MSPFEHPHDLLGMPEPVQIAAAGTSFPIATAGQGSAVLFVHGAWADLRIWHGVWKDVAEKNKYLAMTQRHFGSGVWSSDKLFSRDVHTSDLIALLKALNTPVNLVGWSYAGGILLNATSQVPELVRSLVIFEPSFESEALPKNNDSLLHAREVFWEELEPAYKIAQTGDLHAAMRLGIEVVFGLGKGGFTTLDPSAQRVFLDNAHTMIPDLEAPAPQVLNKAELSNILCPVLICCGERTHEQYKMMAESTLADLPNGVLRLFEDVGHGGPVQVPKKFSEAVLNFVGAHGP